MAAIVEDKSAARERVLSSARELFYREGIGGVGVDTVVEHAGVAKMTLYKHFGSKDALVCEYLRRLDDEWTRRFTDRVEKRAALPGERLLALFDVLADDFSEPGYRGCAFINAASELPDANHPARRQILAHKHRLRQYVQSLTLAAKLRSAGALADQLVLLMDGAMVWAMMSRSPEPARRARAAAEALIAAA